MSLEVQFIANQKEEIMIIDRYTKVALSLIAISLFLISLNPWIAPIKAYAEWGFSDSGTLSRGLDGIAEAIQWGFSDSGTLSRGLDGIAGAIRRIDCGR